MSWLIQQIKDNITALLDIMLPSKYDKLYDNKDLGDMTSDFNNAYIMLTCKYD